jgi:Asp-tRNA(Asn)/Glu-tRNA(Gln) amidotransferase A subunit family amidase
MVESHSGIVGIEGDRSVRQATGGSLTAVNATLRARLETRIDRFVGAGGNADIALGRLRAMRDDALASYRRTTGNIDVLVAPAMRRSPPRIEHALTDFEWVADLTRPFNCSQQPVVCIPVGWTEAGLPIGLQIVATKYRERSALRVAHTFEQSEHAPEPRWPELTAQIAEPRLSQGPQD